MQHFFAHYPYIEIHCSSSPDTENYFDVFILPSEVYSSCNYNFSHNILDNAITIAYGSENYLKHAFLSGCFDYLKEPWTPEELYFRIIKHAHRRFGTFQWHEMVFFPFYGTYQNTVITLSKHEYAVMYMLVKNNSSVITRSQLGTALWGKDKPSSRAIDMHISSIRKKFAKHALPSAYCIETIHGEGYFIR